MLKLNEWNQFYFTWNDFCHLQIRYKHLFKKKKKKLFCVWWHFRQSLEKSILRRLAFNLHLQVKISVFHHVIAGVAAAAAHARTSPGAGTTGGAAAGHCLPASGHRFHSSHLRHAATKCQPSTSSTGACGGPESKGSYILAHLHCLLGFLLFFCCFFSNTFGFSDDWYPAMNRFRPTWRTRPSTTSSRHRGSRWSSTSPPLWAT